MAPAGTIHGQDVRGVGTRELSHRTAAVIRSVRPGERVVVMRHAEPQAVLLSVRDAMELLIERELESLAANARRDFEEGTVELLGRPGLFRVVLARRAAHSLEAMRPRDRRLLRDALARGAADDDRLLWLSSGRWVATFSYPDEATALVHGAFMARELERELIGEEIWRKRQRIAIDRGMHGRASWQLGRGRAGWG